MEGAPTGGELMANRKQNHMGWMGAVIPIILWLPKLLSSYTIGAFVHLLLVLAVVMVLVGIIQGRRLTQEAVSLSYLRQGKMGGSMRPKTIMAGLLIVLGIVVLAYSGITYQTRGKPVEIGVLHIETTKSHFIPPAVGAVALVGGVMLLVLDTQKA